MTSRIEWPRPHIKPAMCGGIRLWECIGGGALGWSRSPDAAYWQWRRNWATRPAADTRRGRR